MDHAQEFQTLLSEARAAYLASSAAAAFAPFPSDVIPQALTPYHCPCGDVFCADTALISRAYAPLQAALIAASPFAQWRETYKGTDIGDDFLDRFGCYAIIGAGGPFTSQSLWAWMVYMPAQFYYPWHHHPGEEMYLVISGSATFRRAGCEDEVLGEGSAVYHASNQPHAMQTGDAPVLCLVFWRNGFETAPVLTPSETPGSVHRATVSS